MQFSVGDHLSPYCYSYCSHHHHRIIIIIIIICRFQQYHHLQQDHITHTLGGGGVIRKQGKEPEGHNKGIKIVTNRRH
jgi:hypothetical protein